MPRQAVAGLAQKTASGFAWQMIQTVAVKGINLGGQILLARLLMREAFGVVSLAMALFTFANLLQEAGLQQVLIHRQEKFARWANPAFWLSVAIGLAGGLLLAVAAPLAAAYWHKPVLTGMILVLALRSPLSALGIVPGAWLQSQLRFKVLTVIGLIEAAAAMLLSVVFALCHFGAYSFVLPMPIVALVRSAVLWRTARPPVRLNLQTRRWKYLLGDSGILLLTFFFFTITGQGDYMILGRRFDEAVVGVYFFAFQFTLQTTQFFTVNLAKVLFPTLARLQHEPERQRRAFLRAMKMLMLFGVPVCLVQAALAGPMVRLLFDAKWLPSIPVLQVISIGMSLQLVNWPALNMMQAQGRFKTLLGLSLFCAVSFIGLVWGATLFARWGDGSILWQPLDHALSAVFGRRVDVGTVVAVAVAVYCAVIGPVCLFAAIRPVGGSWRDIWPIYLTPLALSAATIGLASFVGGLIPDVRGHDWLQLLAIGAVSVGLYLPLVRLAARDSWIDLIQRVRGMSKRTPVAAVGVGEVPPADRPEKVEPAGGEEAK